MQLEVKEPKMENSNTTCPVCTLYLREGITLQAHLDTHPKEQVIEALLKVSNGGLSVQTSQASATTAGSYVPVQSVVNSNSPFGPQGPTYVNPQTQMTTAVTYQHFMTSNGSTILPQYIQVPTIVNPNSNIPLISNQAMNYVPNQSLNYSQTVYNPLYNPYIPQPYPFSQPIFTSFPVSSLQQVDSSIQTSSENLNSSSQVGNGQVGTLIQSSVSVKKCTVATSTDSETKNSKNSGTKKSFVRYSPARKKVKILKPKSSESVVKTVLKNSLKNSVKVGVPKPTVIRTLKTKLSTGTCSSRIISPPPLTLITGTASRSMSGAKTPPPPPLAKAPYFVPQILNFIKSEETSDSLRPQSTPAIISDLSNTSNNNDIDYLGQVKLNSVIVESSNLIQGSSNEMRDCKENVENDESQIPIMETLLENVVISKENESDILGESTKDPLSTEEISNELEEYNENEDGDDDEDFEKREKVFQMIEVVENKVDILDATLNQDIPKEISSENIERNCDGSDIFIQQENILFNEDSNKERAPENTSYPEFVEVRPVEAENKSLESENHAPNDYSFYNKDFNEFSYETNRPGSEGIRVDGSSKQTESQSVTYTDLQPAKSLRVFQDLGLSSSINFNNYMEVDGIKIFFNNNASNVPFDPLLKLTSIQTKGRNVSTFMKTENQVANHTIVDSVIQLVSGNPESKNEVSFGDNYSATTSQVNENHVDLPDLSPLALNIQADESMPARGELSEQESLGAENSTWNLFHGNNMGNAKSFEEWRNDNTQSVSVIGSKKSAKSFKCSTCNEVFSCPKERRVHKNTVHLNKSNKMEKSISCKKQKNYQCSFCSEIFTCLRDRKLHVIQNHYPDSKSKKNVGEIKKENPDLDCVNMERSDAAVKNEAEQEHNVKTETSLTSTDAESHRVKYCSRCSLPFVGVKKLREHLRLVHGEIRFKCETCSSCFDEESEYNDHLLVHPLVCNKCGKTFHRKPNLNLHMKRHLEVKPYECSLCPKSFITRQKLEEHMNGHSGKKPIKCTFCDKTFSRHSNLIQHKNLHHLNVKKKVKDFVCRCGEVFHSLRKLEWHKEVHEPKPKPCPFCSQKFIHSASVTRHIRRAHLPDYLPGDNREFDNVQCPICEKVYLRSSLAVHMRVHNGEKPFACKICNKRFSTKWNLELHNWTHQSRSNMPFKCHICKSAFFREPDFVAHLNSHRNYKPFTCNICGQKFIRKYSCLRHQEEHKKSKQFVCAVSGCAKSFHRGYYLRDHMKVHTGVRPHTCHICGKASSTKSNHNKHVRIHDTREPVNTEN